MLQYDPIPWLLAQDGLPALRARRRLHVKGPDDDEAARDVLREYARAQGADGSFDRSLLKTAGVVNLLVDLGLDDARSTLDAAAAHLLDMLIWQPGYERAADVAPGSLTMPFDLCGFFGPYDLRNEPAAVKYCTREFLVTPTKTVPSGPTATAIGFVNSPAPVPSEPHMPRKEPLAVKYWTRWLRYSVT